MDGVDWFKNRYPQSWQNIADDVILSLSQKQTLMDLLSTLDVSDELKGIAEIRSFFRAQKLLGNVLSLSDQIVLGNITRREEMVTQLASVLGISAANASSVLDDLLNETDLSSLKDFLGNAPLAGGALGDKGIMWSFHNPLSNNEPFRDVELDTLPCQLGTELVNRPYIYRSHRSTTVTYHQSTAFDAGVTHQGWRPGGMTAPLPHCPTLNGFPEVVHRPATFNDLIELLGQH